MLRRKFNKLIASSAIPLIVSDMIDMSSSKDGLTILFQGDSITDAGRDRSRYYANHAGGLGDGYVGQIATDLLGQNHDKNLKIYNRGISGHKVYQLADRWEEDCMQLKPDILSILIGVNDFWHMLNGHYDGTAEIYDRDFRALIDRTLRELPDLELIIAEPFCVAGGSAVGSERWVREFPAYQELSKKIAEDYGAAFIPLQSIFEEALQKSDVSYWCPDGVHPSMAGSYIMAEAWLSVLAPMISK